MGKNELAVMKDFQIVTGFEGMDPELIEELKEQMADLDDERGIACRKIKIPAGGGKVYEVEGDDPDDPEIMKEIQGVILFTHRMNSYWATTYGSGDNANMPPTCCSMDAKMGVNLETGEIRNCDNCPMNQFGEEGKECKNMRRIYLLMSGRPDIYLLSVPPTSIKDINKNLARIMGSNRIPYTMLVVTFKLNKAVNKNGIEYSKVLVEKTGMLTADQYERTSAMRKQIKEKYKEVAITHDDYNVTTGDEPEAGTAGAEVTDADFVEVPREAEENLPFN